MTKKQRDRQGGLVVGDERVRKWLLEGGCVSTQEKENALLAAEHGRSVEAELRAIPEATVKPQTRLRMGEELAALGSQNGLSNEDIALINAIRDTTPAEPMRFDE